MEADSSPVKVAGMPSLPSRLELVFSAYAWAKLAHAASGEPTEVGAMTVTSPHNPLYVEDVCFIKQYASAGFVRLDDEAVADKSADLGNPFGQYKLHPANFAYVFIHTHPAGMNRPSGHDEDTFSEKFGGYPWSVMFIMTKDLKTYCRMRINSGGSPVQVEIPVRVDYLLPFPGSDHAGWDRELLNVLPLSDVPKPAVKASRREIVVPTFKSDGPSTINYTFARELQVTKKTYDHGSHLPRARGPSGKFVKTTYSTLYLTLHKFLPHASLRLINSLGLTPLLSQEIETPEWEDTLSSLSRIGIEAVVPDQGGEVRFQSPTYFQGVVGLDITRPLTRLELMRLLYTPMNAGSVTDVPFLADFVDVAEAFETLITEDRSRFKRGQGTLCMITGEVDRKPLETFSVIPGIRMRLTTEEYAAMEHAQRTGLYDEIVRVLEGHDPTLLETLSDEVIRSVELDTDIMNVESSISGGEVLSSDDVPPMVPADSMYSPELLRLVSDTVTQLSLFTNDQSLLYGIPGGGRITVLELDVCLTRIMSCMLISSFSVSVTEIDSSTVRVRSLNAKELDTEFPLVLMDWIIDIKLSLRDTYKAILDNPKEVSEYSRIIDYLSEEYFSDEAFSWVQELTSYDDLLLHSYIPR